VGTFTWPPAGTYTWPLAGTLTWPRTPLAQKPALDERWLNLAGKRRRPESVSRDYGASPHAPCAPRNLTAGSDGSMNAPIHRVEVMVSAGAVLVTS